MGSFHDEISEGQAAFIKAQKMFFVGSCPLSANGRVNISPKGFGGTFRIINPNKVCYMELTGSGIETLSHVRESGRLTIMFCAFEGPPKIVRLFGTAVAYDIGSPEYDALEAEYFNDQQELTGKRSIFVVDVTKVGQSCGFGVPLMEYKAPRDTLLDYWRKKDKLQMQDYWKTKNAESIDGIPSHLGQRQGPSVWSKAIKHAQALAPYGLTFSAGAVVGISIYCMTRRV
ncbi:hypothetical protein BZG36_01998 [Bifiguratus adelaidae]|uniref:Pyridoxamine 5'-phosphate oxidase N-terminal domain-containing protein n=1 Tax=Bifiguratus adelaidae TaxID=1938954 RepID=A0A261Y413_9FUNG|nr:hypothetical protein BZG36_01998 [Bifiguratus adelaidae]